MIETKTRKFNKKMGLNFILASVIFYFLPDFILIDPLPDIIGYALAAYGLTMLGDICEDLADARRRFMKMMIVGGARLFGLFVAFAMFGANERPTAMLTVTFVLGIVECVFLIPAVKSLFDGLIYLGTRYNGTAVFNRPSKNGKRVRKDRNSYSDTVKRQAVFFVILKNICSILPEMLALSADSDSQYYNYNRYDQINYFRVLSMIVVIIAGIVWVRRMMRYLRALMNDTPFMDSLAEKYRTEVLPNESIFFRRRAFFAFILMSIGAFAAIDFYIDAVSATTEVIEMNIIPDIICAICLMAGVYMISAKNGKWRMPAIAGTAVYGVISSISWKINYDFAYKYTAEEVSRDVTANSIWKLLTALSVFEAICFTGMVWLVCSVLKEVIEEHTGYVSQYATFDPLEHARQLHATLQRWLLVTVIFAAVAGVAGVFRVWMFCSESFIADLSWIIELTLTAAFAFMFSYSISKIKEGIEEKYMLS